MQGRWRDVLQKGSPLQSQSRTGVLSNVGPLNPGFQNQEGGMPCAHSKVTVLVFNEKVISLSSDHKFFPAGKSHGNRVQLTHAEPAMGGSGLQGPVGPTLAPPMPGINTHILQRTCLPRTRSR